MITQLAACLTADQGIIVTKVNHKLNQWPFLIPYTDSRRAIVSYWRMYWYTVLIVLGSLRLPKNSSSRLIDRLDMTFIVLSGA